MFRGRNMIDGPMKYRLLYIGKSGKDFTHDRVYKIVYGPWTSTAGLGLDDYDSFTLSGNRGQLIQFDESYHNYIQKNFKLLTDEQYNKYIRKIKLKKLSR